MIDLNRTRVGLLEELEAPRSGPWCDITDPQVLAGDARVRLRGRSRADLLPVLKVALSERFASVPRPVLMRDLFMPLKHALGNAHKHGNARDLAKTVTVELELTTSGALVSVTDQGDGFDVASIVQGLQQQETYFVYHGAGFRGLHEARSPVTWENGGRTLLLCFRRAIPESDVPRVPWHHQVCGEDEDDAGHRAVLRRALDPAWIASCLSEELPELRTGRAKLEACHAYLNGGAAGDDCGLRYVLRVARPHASGCETRIFTGRLHANEHTAAADFEAATELHARQWSGSVRIPSPLARLTADRRLVIYDFDPWMNLWQYLGYRASNTALRHSARRVATALATVHQSPVPARLARSAPAAVRLQTTAASAERVLGELPGGSEYVGRLRAGVRRIRDTAPVPRRNVRTPVHGALGWDRIHQGVDGAFYFYRFEACQQADPGIDLGGFAADLLRFARASRDESVYRLCCDELLTRYNAKMEYPVDPERMPLYVALALCERLRDAHVRSGAEVDELLAALDAAAQLS